MDMTKTPAASAGRVFLSRMFRCASRPRVVIDSARGVIDGSPVRKKTL
jgi:hypothetical protein